MTLDKNKELIARLRNDGSSWAQRMFDEAAAALEAAGAKVAGLERELLSQIEHRDANRRRAEAAESRADRLAAENERMQGALDKMQRSRDRYRKAWEEEKSRAALTAPAPGGEKLQDAKPVAWRIRHIEHRGNEHMWVYSTGTGWVTDKPDQYDIQPLYAVAPASPRNGGE